MARAVPAEVPLAAPEARQQPEEQAEQARVVLAPAAQAPVELRAEPAGRRLAALEAQPPAALEAGQEPEEQPEQARVVRALAAPRAERLAQEVAERPGRGALEALEYSLFTRL